MFRVILLTLTGLFIVFTLASAPEFNRGREMTPAFHTQPPAGPLTAQATSSQIYPRVIRISVEQ